MNSIVDGVTAKLAEDHPNTGPGVAHALSKVGWGALVVASSLPIRDVDAHLDRAGKVIANRGASGIDGFVSTALGVAGVVERTAALSGDLSLLHDSNGFLADGLDDLVLVVVDNGGGGLFDNLPQASHAPDFERLFIAGQNRDLALLAAFHGLAYAVCEDAAGLPAIVDASLLTGGRHLIRVPVDRRSDLEARRDLDDAARAVVSSGPTQYGQHR
jgi:2-succinyl-5-enolpyruvyl-6-hydroxy-3-cyclohexene-1-carboxylate synthase